MGVTAEGILQSTEESSAAAPTAGAALGGGEFGELPGNAPSRSKITNNST